MTAMHGGSSREARAWQRGERGRSGADQHSQSRHPHGGSEEDEKYPEHEKKCRKYQLQGDFLIHCHVEMHMMEGMAAVLRRDPGSGTK